MLHTHFLKFDQTQAYRIVPVLAWARLKSRESTIGDYKWDEPAPPSTLVARTHLRSRSWRAGPRTYYFAGPREMCNSNELRAVSHSWEVGAKRSDMLIERRWYVGPEVESRWGWNTRTWTSRSVTEKEGSNWLERSERARCKRELCL